MPRPASLRQLTMTFFAFGSVVLAGAQASGQDYFTDVTAEVGLTGVAGFRLSVADVNGDGYPDLFVHIPQDEASGDVLDKQFLYLNQQGASPDPLDRVFVDYTATSGIRANRQGTSSGRHTSGAVFADVDNDGDLDLFTIVYNHTNYSLDLGRNDLMVNDGSGVFTLSANSTFHLDPIWNTAGAVFLDYDLDGKVDIFLGNWYRNNVMTQDRLYQGHGDGSFTDVSATAGISSATSAVYGVAVADWNDDGLPDIFAPSYSHTATGSTPIQWRNNGNDTFSQVQVETAYNLYRGYGSGKASFGSMFWDYDNDGDMDFLEILTHGVGDGAGQVHTTVVTNVDDVFSWDFGRVSGRAAEDPDLTHHGDHYGTWFDMDHDGLWDFALTECGYSNNRIYVFQQSAGNTFSPVTPLTGLNAINIANLPPHNVMALDYDLDGDEDLLVGFASADGIQMWRNDMDTGNSWLTVSLEGDGVKTNRSAIGARVQVTAAGTTWTRQVFAGNGHMGPQMPLSQNFGLGTATIVSMVKITWPNAARTTTVRAGVSVNQFITAHDSDILATSFETEDCVGWSMVIP